jgi:uncharacterized protein YjbI with pentapeptide repeats
MQLLAAYIRDESPKDEADATTDIVVAAIVVARNPLGNGLRTDLHNAGLTNAELHESQFHGADLSGAQLGGVEFHRADLTAADLGNANLQRFAPSDDMMGVVLAAWRDETNCLPPQRPWSA